MHFNASGCSALSLSLSLSLSTLISSRRSAASPLCEATVRSCRASHDYLRDSAMELWLCRRPANPSRARSQHPPTDQGEKRPPSR
jgi:hypothetical protein